MGGIFSLEASAASGSEVNANRGLDNAAAAAAACAADEPVGASLAEASMSARQDSMTSLSSVTDSTSNAGGEGVGPAEVLQG